MSERAGLTELIAAVLATENVRLVGSNNGRWEEAAPAVAEAVRLWLVATESLVADVTADVNRHIHGTKGRGTDRSQP